MVLRRVDAVDFDERWRGLAGRDSDGRAVVGDESGFSAGVRVR